MSNYVYNKETGKFQDKISLKEYDPKEISKSDLEMYDREQEWEDAKANEMDFFLDDYEEEMQPIREAALYEVEPELHVQAEYIEDECEEAMKAFFQHYCLAI